MTIGVQGRTHGNEDEAISAAYVLGRATSWCKELLIVMTYKVGREEERQRRIIVLCRLTSSLNSQRSQRQRAASYRKAGVDDRREISEAYPREDGVVLNVGKKTLMQQ